MRKQIRGLDQASTNAEDGVSAVQTAEGALTEVHSMLQRMNELAVQASNGTNSTSDRQAIQDEISQLNTEIDRVAETTKFNEIYLLKGDDSTKNVYMKGHDAGLKGTLTDSAKEATFKVAAGALDAGKSVTIGGKEYTIGATVAEGKAVYDSASNGDTITVNGTAYKLADATDEAKGEISKTDLDAKVVKGATIEYGSNKATVLNDTKTTGVDDADSSVISAAHAVELMKNELIAANKIGVTGGTVSIDGTPAYDKAKGVTFNIKRVMLKLQIDSLSIFM